MAFVLSAFCQAYGRVHVVVVDSAGAAQAIWREAVREPRLAVDARPRAGGNSVVSEPAGGPPPDCPAEKRAAVCPNGNPACQSPACRNPNCGVGKRGSSKKQAQAAAAPAGAALGAVRQSINAGTAPLQMRSAQRYPLSYPRRYVHTSAFSLECNIWNICMRKLCARHLCIHTLHIIIVRNRRRRRRGGVPAGTT